MKKSLGKVNFIAYCGAHYRACPIEIRELWAKALLIAHDPIFVKRIFEKHADSKIEIIPISTCNRFDICILGEISENAILLAFLDLAKFAAEKDTQAAIQLQKTPLTIENLRNFIRISFDDNAVHQLFRVGASLDSLVLGEPHILGQLKESFQFASQGGLCENDASALFNRCFQVAKRVRSETDLGKNGISIGHAAVEVSRRIFANLERKKALVLGTGEMGRIVAQHFKACGIGQLTLANRTLATAERVALEHQNAHVMAFETVLTQLENFDIIVVATSANEYLIGKSHVKNFSKIRNGNPSVVVDISVPRNVDPAISSLVNIFSFDVDDLDKIMESNRETRKQAAIQAETIVQGEVISFLQSRKHRHSLIHVGRFHTWVRTLVEKEILRSLRNSSQINSDTAAVIADAVAKKIISPAANFIRTETQVQWDTLENVGEALELLFKLSEQNAADVSDKNAQNIVSISKGLLKRQSGESS